MDALRAPWPAWRWHLTMRRRCPMSKAKRQPGRERKLRPFGGAGEFRPDADIPDDTGRELVPQSNLRPDGGRVAMTRRLLGEDVAHQGCAREAWSTDRIARANGELVAPVTLVVSGRTEELVAGIEMQAQALDGLRDDALGLD